ncbi:S26 family signal peptidase [Halorubrum ezzemoulense]|uniref:S26 family signal peptidase n=1 Tax=Halorubrum ezzemoulense TaxID=337243 RepID=A0A481RD00_HALEZ|nr:S26 family signal peptidase [Halorubrum ezzemoulense]QAY19106.1 S26 family signal peptidase [Halorubrum ezzemoulense]
MLREVAERTETVLLVVVLVSLILGQVFGQPVLLACVDSGSMEPTIDEGDGFLTVPAAVTGPPTEGDVITFRAKEIGEGGLTTHRIVGGLYLEDLLLGFRMGVLGRATQRDRFKTRSLGYSRPEMRLNLLPLGRSW